MFGNNKIYIDSAKKGNVQQQSWFTHQERGVNHNEYITDSPFLCLLKFIMTEDFSANQNDMSLMLKILSEMLKRYLKFIKDKIISVDAETLDVMFKLITLKIDQDFIKQICILFYSKLIYF
jgi:hypothetical protein